MRKIILICCLFTAISAIAQDKISPVIKQGTKLSYIVITGDGQNLPFNASLDSLSPDYVKIGWDIQGLGTGAWIMKKASLENGTRGYWGQPPAGQDEVLADDQNVVFFSRAQWSSLQKDKKLQFDQQTYTVKEPTTAQQLKLSGKIVDAVFLEGQSGSHLWILNNASTPILLKMEGNTSGPDIELHGIN